MYVQSMPMKQSTAATNPRLMPTISSPRTPWTYAIQEAQGSDNSLSPMNQASLKGTYVWQPTAHHSLCSLWRKTCPSHSPSTGLTNTRTTWSSSCRLCRLQRWLSSSSWLVCSWRRASRGWKTRIRTPVSDFSSSFCHLSLRSFSLKHGRFFSEESSLRSDL